MASQTGLPSIADHWAGVLANPAIAQMYEQHHTLKGDGCGHDHGKHDHEHGDHCHHNQQHDHEHEHNDPVEQVIHDLKSLSQGEPGEGHPEIAQTLYFLQQLVKTQIRALEKSTIPGIKDRDVQNLINDLTRRLAEIENIISPQDLERLAKAARNRQRRDDKEWASLNGYRNWLDGTLTDDQSAVLKAFQWKTASGRFQPLKIVADTADHFAEEHLKDRTSILTTALITKLVYDSIVFMTSVTGAHQITQDAAINADKILAETNTGPADYGLDTLQALSGSGTNAELEALLDARCMDKVNTDTSLVGMGIEEFAADYCHEISEILQTWFAISTATPRTLQAGQKEIAEGILMDGSVAAEAYEWHHQAASKLVDWLAFYDNALHVVLLGVGSLVGAKLIRRYGIKGGPKKMFQDLNQQLSLAKKRPGAFIGVFAGAAAYAASHEGEVLNTDILPYLVVGALAGVLGQRAKIHLTENRSFIFNLHANAPITQNSYVPPTSLDHKSHKLRNAFATALAVSGLIVTANNTGLINHQSPELLRTMVEYNMAGWAWPGAILSWAIFDRLDDFVYHKTFFGTGVPLGASFAAAAIGASALLSKVPGVPHVKKAWKKAVEVGKNNIRPLVLAAGLNMASADDGARNFNSSNIVWPSQGHTAQPSLS